ncbi:TIP41-like protein isoform X2 [Periplaneta americana]|uniref:TIP41-like protein isoform X2 n=1 Tax=Periplaneta americana TaxID=6978 RepID=UPI0037E94979
MESHEGDIMRLPINSEEHTFNNWEVKYKRSHILHSKCSNEKGCGDDLSETCLFCLYTRMLELPHMPDMVFPNNQLILKHVSGCSIEFNALDALKRVSNGRLAIKIACADAWKESRMESGHLDEVKPFDWTFTTDYTGTLTGDFSVTTTETRIDLDKLRRRERILFYHDLLLFEDELHDNGTAVCSVKIVPPSRLIDPSEVAQILPLVSSCYEKLSLPTVKQGTGEGAAVAV